MTRDELSKQLHRVFTRDGKWNAEVVGECGPEFWVAWIDARLAAIFTRGELYRKPKDLQPFPILGMPGWDPANGEEAYYDNTDYFRSGRRGSKQTGQD